MKRELMWGLALGAGYAFLASRPSRLRIERRMQADPADLLRLVAEVEREPEFIPFVTSVQLEERKTDAVSDESETATYRVNAGMLCVSGWARFVKRIRPEAGNAVWQSLGGTAGLQQFGTFESHRAGEEAVTSLHVTTRFSLPILGPLLSHGSAPFLRYAFRRWLRNLEREVQQSESEQPLATRLR